MSLTLGWTWGTSCLFSTIRGTSEMAGSETLILQAAVPVWPSQAPLPTPAPVLGWMGAATSMSLQGGCVQSGDASEDSSATYSDSRGSKLREPSGTIGKYRNAGSPWPLALTLEQWSRRKSFFRLSFRFWWFLDNFHFTFLYSTTASSGGECWPVLFV